MNRYRAWWLTDCCENNAIIYWKKIPKQPPGLLISSYQYKAEFTKGRPKLCVRATENIRHFILWIAFNYNLIVPFQVINWENIHVRHIARRMIISINRVKGIDDANLCWYRRIYFHVQRETYYQWLPIVKGSWRENVFRSRFLKLGVCCIYMSFIANLNQNITLKKSTALSNKINSKLLILTFVSSYRCFIKQSHRWKLISVFIVIFLLSGIFAWPRWM